MSIAYDQHVKLRLSAEVEGQSEVESLSKSADELTKDLENVGDASRLSAARQAEAAARLAEARKIQDDIRLSLISAQNGYRALAARAKESGAAQSLFAQQAEQAKNRVGELKQEMAVARGNVNLLSREHRGAASETRRLVAEQVRLRQSLRDISNESGNTQQSLALLKTGAKAAAGAFAGMQASHSFVEANLSIEAAERALTQITGSVSAASKEIDWLRQATNRLGIDTQSATRAYISLAAAAKGTALDGDGARRVFEAVAGSMAKLGKSSADTEGALQAISQMIGKGVVSMEEMRQQLAERLPGAFQATADAMGLSVAELSTMIASGNVLAEDLLPKLAEGLEKAYGTTGKVDGTVSAWNRIKNAITETWQLLGQSGPMQAAAGVLEVLGKSIRLTTGAFENLGVQIGIAAGAVATFDLSRPIESLKEWRAASLAAGQDIARRHGLTAEAADKVAAAQIKAGENAAAAGRLANDAAVGWNTVINSYGKVAEAALATVGLTEKSVAARAEEAKAALGLANALGTENERREAAQRAATMNYEALQALASARQNEVDVAQAQVQAMEAVTAAAGVESDAKRKAIQEAQQKANTLQEEADKANAAALTAQQHAAALQTETLALQDNSLRVAELEAAYAAAANQLEIVRINREVGAATAGQLADAEIAAAQAAALYRDALNDQTAALQRKHAAAAQALQLDNIQVKLAIEQQRTILELARVRGDEASAARAMNEIRKLEIKLQELSAQAKAAEARALLETVRARRAELAASGELTAAKQAELEAQERSAEIKQVEAQIATETARRMRQLSAETTHAGESAGAASGGYDRLVGSLRGVAHAAREASQEMSSASSFLDGGRQADRAVDVESMLYAQGATIEEAKAAAKYYGELFEREQATTLTGYLGNDQRAARLTNVANDRALRQAIELARVELATGQQVDIGNSVSDYRKQALANIKYGPSINGQKAQSQAIASAGRQAISQTYRIDLSFNGKKGAQVSVASESEANQVKNFFRMIEADMRRAL